MSEPLCGGCLCGAICYRISDVFDAGYCHCKTCREATGGAVVVWAHVPSEAFESTRGAPSRYAASEEGTRCFCGQCGSSLYFKASDRGYVSVNIATLDAPESVRPAVHICTESRLSYLQIDDSLPRFTGREIPHPDRRGDE
jgi:hypothetical protein